MHRRLARKHLVYVVAFSLLTAVCAAAVTVYIDYRQDLAEVDAALARIERSYVAAIASSVFDFNLAQLEVELNGVVQFRDVVYLQVTEPGGDGSRILAAAGDPATTADRIRDYPLVREVYGTPRDLGTLRVHASFARAKARLLTRTLMALGASAVHTLLIGLCVLWIVQVLTVRRLTRIAEFTERLDVEALDEALVLSETPSRGEDELDQIAHAINGLLDRVRSTLDRLHDEIEERRRAQEERLRFMMAIEQADESIVVTDPEGRVEYVNPAFERVTGYGREETIGQTLGILKSSAHDDAFYHALWETLSSGSVWKGRLNNRRKNGETYTEDAVISPVRQPSGATAHYVAAMRDVTRELSLEEQYRQAQKMEALGTLAGGIAHDFNNILHALVGFGDLLHEDLAAAAPDALPQLDQMLTCAERARELVAQILAFSRRTPGDRRPLHLGLLVKEAARMLRGAIPRSVSIDIQTSPEGDTVVGDVSQLHQIIMNLCTNAWQAMAETGGTLSVRVEPHELDGSPEGALAELAPGPYVRLTVADTGVGIAPSDQSRIFDPFFTTKPSGEGTGLGLAVVHGLVADHGGAIAVCSEPGHGTTFEVLLPRVPGETLPNTAEEPSEPLPRGSARVLVVDDEEAVLRINSRLLESLGYRTTTAPGAEAALQTFLADPEGFDLVMTDLTMPGMTGIELAAKMHQARPRTPIILCTGYGDALANMDAHGLGFSATLIKPVRKRELARVVHQVVRNGAPPG